MPKFPKNTSAFKMKGSPYTKTSPNKSLKDVYKGVKEGVRRVKEEVKTFPKDFVTGIRELGKRVTDVLPFKAKSTQAIQSLGLEDKVS